MSTRLCDEHVPCDSSSSFIRNHLAFDVVLQRREKDEVFLWVLVNFFNKSSGLQQSGSALTFSCVRRALTLHAGFQ